MPPIAAIAIICKVPLAGSSKTRLIPALGADRAAALSRAFLIDLSGAIETAAAAVGAKGYAVCSPPSAATELARFLPPSFGYVVETDPALGLGGVLDGSVAELLKRGHDCVVLVNGDSPTLPAALLRDAVEALRRPGERAVFGPALDGGYTLVGLKRREPRLFADIPWSTPAVLVRSLERAEQLGLAVTMTAPWYDIDDAQSLAWLVAELRGQPVVGLTATGSYAPHTRAVLADDL